MPNQADLLIHEVALILIPAFFITAGVIVVSVFQIIRLRRVMARYKAFQFQEVEKERKRIANDLHDYVAGKLVVIRGNLLESLKKIDNPDVMRSVHKSLDDIGTFHDDLRYQVEYIYPKELMVNNLRGSFEKLAEEMSNAQTKVIADVEFTTELTRPQTHQLFRIAQETTSNIIAYSKPKNVFISLTDDEVKKYGELSIAYHYPDVVKTDRQANRLLRREGRGRFVINERLKILKATTTWYQEDGIFQDITRFPLK